MKKTIFLLVLIGAIAAVAYYYKKPDDKKQTADDKELLGTQPNNITDTIAGNAWTGTLKKSDISTKGNLMLVFPDQSKVYIQTSRDFSNLIDKEVVVEIKGSKESFQLIEIHPAN
jgi:hypothetical protein